jgi:hypothetical protein
MEGEFDAIVDLPRNPINKQKYIELVAEGRLEEAVKVLQNDLSGLAEFHQLGSLLLCSNMKEVSA